MPLTGGILLWTTSHFSSGNHLLAPHHERRVMSETKIILCSCLKKRLNSGLTGVRCASWRVSTILALLPDFFFAIIAIGTAVTLCTCTTSASLITSASPDIVRRSSDHEKGRDTKPTLDSLRREVTTAESREMYLTLFPRAASSLPRSNTYCSAPPQIFPGKTCTIFIARSAIFRRRG